MRRSLDSGSPALTPAAKEAAGAPDERGPPSLGMTTSKKRGSRDAESRHVSGYSVALADWRGQWQPVSRCAGSSALLVVASRYSRHAAEGARSRARETPASQ